MAENKASYTFPSYLLPSIPLSFRRRSSTQPSSSTCTPSPSPPDSLPSLCSSPTSPISPSPSTSTSTSSTSPSPSSSPSPTTTPQNLPTTPSPDLLVCLHCATHLAYTSQITSKGFTGRHGRAYLVSPPPAPAPAAHTPGSRDLVNVRVGRPATRQLVTGQHVVADISCRTCGTVVGWKYVDAKESAQRYKIGRFILEVMRVGRVGGWEGSGGMQMRMGIGGRDDGEDGVGEARDADDDADDGADDDGEVLFDSDDEHECEELFAGTWDADVVRKRRGRRGWMRGGR